MMKTYETMELLRGKRRNEELTQLAIEEKDFEYRRLFIEESALDIQVAFSRSELCKDISSIFLFFAALAVISDGPMWGITLCLSAFFKLMSMFHLYHYKRFTKITRNTLLFVDGVIKSTYGITLPKYL